MKLFCKVVPSFSLLSSTGGWDEVIFYERGEIFCLTAVYLAYLHLWMGDMCNLKLMHVSVYKC